MLDWGLFESVCLVGESLSFYHVFCFINRFALRQAFRDALRDGKLSLVKEMLADAPEQWGLCGLFGSKSRNSKGKKTGAVGSTVLEISKLGSS